MHSQSSYQSQGSPRRFSRRLRWSMSLAFRPMIICRISQMQIQCSLISSTESSSRSRQNSKGRILLNSRKTERKTIKTIPVYSQKAEQSQTTKSIASSGKAKILDVLTQKTKEQRVNQKEDKEAEMKKQWANEFKLGEWSSIIHKQRVKRYSNKQTIVL